MARDSTAAGWLSSPTPSFPRKSVGVKIEGGAATPATVNSTEDALKRRNAPYVAAAEALVEASASESIIRCMSMFSELLSSAKIEDPHPSIDQFFSLHEMIVQSTNISKALA